MRRTVHSLVLAAALVVIGSVSGCSANAQLEDELKVQRKELANQGQVIAKLQGDLSEIQAQKQLLEQVRKLLDTSDDNRLGAKVPGTWEVYSRTDQRTDYLMYVLELRADGRGQVLEAYVVRGDKEKEEVLGPYGKAAIANPMPGTHSAVKKRPGPVAPEIQWKVAEGKVAIELIKDRYAAAVVAVGEAVFLLGLTEKGAGFVARRAVLKQDVPGPPKGPAGK